MQECQGVRHDECYGGEELARMQKCEARHDHGPYIDSEHHLILVNSILFVDSALPLRGKGVTQQVKGKERNPVHGIVLGVHG